MKNRINWMSAILLVFLASTVLAEEAEPNASVDSMTPEKIISIIKEIDPDAVVLGATTSFQYQGNALALIMAPDANRMRIVTPVIPIEELTPEQVAATMISNYHLALDERYAFGDGLLFSVFIHPLAELTPYQVESAIRQVSSLKQTFGSSYTSGELTFGVQQNPDVEI